MRQRRRGRCRAPARRVHQLARRPRGDDALRLPVADRADAIAEASAREGHSSFVRDARRATPHPIDARPARSCRPIHLATTYARDAAYALVDGRDYSARQEPDDGRRRALLAALEGGAAALTFASGMAATTAAFRALCKPGDHVIGPRVGLLRAAQLARAVLRALGGRARRRRHDRSRGGPRARSARRPGWCGSRPRRTRPGRSPTSPPSPSSRTGWAPWSRSIRPARRRSTAQPLALGADLVMHSATKYLAGHSDVLAGALVTARARRRVGGRSAQLRHDEGAMLGPVEAWSAPARHAHAVRARRARRAGPRVRSRDRLAARGVTVRLPRAADVIRSTRSPRAR